MATLAASESVLAVLAEETAAEDSPVLLDRPARLPLALRLELCLEPADERTDMVHDGAAAA